MGKRILVADDSRTIQQAFAMVMEGSGYTLSFAKSVDEALSVAKRDGRPDLVLSDAVLGTGSGYDLCAQLKADAALADVQVYILASAQTPYDETRGRKVGADGHLAKPFESQALLDAVSSALATPPPRPVSVAPTRAADSGSMRGLLDDDGLVADDEDTYGEITIERGPAPAPSASGWAARPPSRPSVARPISAPAASPAPAPAPRPPILGTPRPPAGLPLGRPSVPPSPAPPPPTQPRHTVMGFPSVRPQVGGRPAAPAGAPVPSPQGAPSRPPTLGPPTAVPMRPPVLAPPPAPAPAVVARPAPPVPSPSFPSPTSSAGARPVVSRFAPPPPVAPEPEPELPASPVPVPAAPITRRSLTPPPPAAAVEPPSGPVASPITAVTDKVEQKLSVLASRGPEFEAIAKLSREIIEQVVWEVVPELAEAIIRQEVDRLASAKK